MPPTCIAIVGGWAVAATDEYVLPLDQASSSSTSRSADLCLAAVVEVSTRHIECLQHFADPTGAFSIAATKLQDARFVDTGIALTFGDSFRTGSTLLYRPVRHRWKTASSEEASRIHSTIERRLESNMPGANLSVQIHQGLNEPPTLEAVQKTTGRAVQLWNPNPQFLGMRWGEASVLRWKDESGDEWQGGSSSLWITFPAMWSVTGPPSITMRAVSEEQMLSAL